MAIVKVLAQRNEPRRFLGKTDICHLTAYLIDGELFEGLEFTAFETYHPVALRVLAVSTESEYPLLVCETEWNLYEDQFVGAVLDSSGTKKGSHFFFDHENKHGPAPL